MNRDSKWVTIADAALLAGRHSSNIYRWIKTGRLWTTVDDSGRTLVDGRQVLDVEAEVRRGRPVGSVSATHRDYGPTRR